MFLIRLKNIIKENITSFSPCADWDVEPEFTDLGLSLAALSIEEPRSGIGNTSPTLHFVVERASCSIFKKDYEDEDTNSLSSCFTFIYMLVCSLFIV